MYQTSSFDRGEASGLQHSPGFVDLNEIFVVLLIRLVDNHLRTHFSQFIIH